MEMNQMELGQLFNKIRHLRIIDLQRQMKK